ncbi:hypothetical protein A9G48_05780 [Gilliamella sp. wkB18]|uniref:hypothetical protein n=1 Tax=Gilliamella sp. wkB18 TaxID=3120260 RepID=UPI000556A72D|nr:hypothetical protein [Gilliamella apicola]OCG63210.1 hypothetical protein A9G48_05780 [Gilliamella apicola]
MKLIKHSLLLVCSFSLVGCFNSEPLLTSTVERWIDNPTINEIKVVIDGTELIIPAKSGVNYTFSYGKHTLSYNNESLNFIAKPSIFNNTGLINPTQSNYFLYTTLYTTSDGADEIYNKLISKYMNFVSIIVDGEKRRIEMPVKVINDVFIERRTNFWDYSVDEPLPNSVTMHRKGQYRSQKVKLYRENSFIETLKSAGVTEEISFPYQPRNFSELKKYSISNLDINSIKCPAGRDHMKKHLQDWHQLFSFTGKDFAIAYKKLISDETVQQNYASLNECAGEKGIEQAYQNVMKSIEKMTNDTKQINFYITD